MDLPENKSQSRFFYDDVLGLHVSVSPLLVSDRVLQAANELGLSEILQWDENGLICGISHTSATKLAQHLGIRMLNIQEFMGLAQRRPEVASPKFAEWLSDTFAICSNGQAVQVTDNPALLDFNDDELGRMLRSRDRHWNIPVARPGWFALDDVGPTGLPTKLSSASIMGHMEVLESRIA
jgi:hypothetical protein